MGGVLAIALIVGAFMLIPLSPFFYQKRRDSLFKTIAEKYHFDLIFHWKENYRKSFGPGDSLPIRTVRGSLNGRDIIIQDVFRMSPSAFSNRYFKIPHILTSESFLQRYAFYFPGSYGRTLSVVDGSELDISNRSFLSVPSFAKRKQIYSLLESLK